MRLRRGFENCREASVNFLSAQRDPSCQKMRRRRTKTRRQALRARFFFALYHTSPCQYNKSRPLRGAVCLCLQKQKYVQKRIRPDRVHRAEWDSPECQGLNTIQVLANLLFPRSRTPCSAIRVCKLLCTGRGADQGGEYGGYRQSPHIPYRHGFRRCSGSSRSPRQRVGFRMW